MTENYGTLYIVGTPIGNLEDITYRAVRILSEVDIIAAEDTRHSLKLLNHLEIKKPLISYHDNNRISRAEELVEKLKEGNNIALISDAGMPAISDPGEKLIALAIKEDIKITVIPGCTASIAGLIISGLTTRRFAFEGFLPQKHSERVKHLESIKYEERTIIFYEGPHRVKDMLKDCHSGLGDRPCSIAREISKIHEQVIRGSISEVLAYFEENEPRGEFVIIIEGSQEKAPDTQKPDFTLISVEEHVEYYIEQGYEKMDAMKLTAKDRGVSKRDVYRLINS